jgi:hypothetical protein
MLFMPPISTIRPHKQPASTRPDRFNVVGQVSNLPVNAVIISVSRMIGLRAERYDEINEQREKESRKGAKTQRRKGHKTDVKMNSLRLCVFA